MTLGMSWGGSQLQTKNSNPLGLRKLFFTYHFRDLQVLRLYLNEYYSFYLNVVQVYI